MRIVKMVAENVKKLRAVEITPKGDVVQITGKNGSGKSSVLDAIFWALAGKSGIDAKPVREGEEKARVVLDLGELIVTRRFTAAGGTSLAVETVDGASYKSPQAVLDKLIGSLAFDPLAFSRMDAKTQLDELRALVPLDLDIDVLDAANRDDFAQRTELNRTLRTVNANLDAELEVEPVDAIDTNALVDALMTASQTNTDRAYERTKRQQGRDQRDLLRATATQLRIDVARLLDEAGLADRSAENLDVRLDELHAVPDDVDLADVRAQIDAAKVTNARAAKYADYVALVTERSRLLGEVTQLEETMAARTAERTAAIARATMPVEGLSFGEGVVLFNALPLGQASSAEQLRVSCALAMAANPTLRVLRIKDGSLLDETALALIGEMATASDFQIWIEVVDSSGTVGIVMEDGTAREASDEAAS